jgi:hypothetical protein
VSEKERRKGHSLRALQLRELVRVGSGAVDNVFVEQLVPYGLQGASETNDK